MWRSNSDFAVDFGQEVCLLLRLHVAGEELGALDVGVTEFAVQLIWCVSGLSFEKRFKFTVVGK